MAILLTCKVCKRVYKSLDKESLCERCVTAKPIEQVSGYDPSYRELLSTQTLASLEKWEGKDA